jgi:membrane associated rhomboid family serine protease
MTDSGTTSEHDTRKLRRSFFIAACFATVLWLIKLVEITFDLDLTPYGVYPLRASGLSGILWAPLIHGSLSHVFANTLPIIILGTALLYGHPRSAKIVIPVIYIGSGVGVWLFARSAYHIGASGLTLGMLLFVFTIGVLRWDKRAIALALIVSFLYGGAIWGIFPGDPRISYESHLFGAAIGVALAILFKTYDPAPPEKKYTWEDEEDNVEDDDGEQTEGRWGGK